MVARTFLIPFPFFVYAVQIDAQGWDTSMVGIIYMTHEEIKKEFGSVDGTTIERAVSLMRSEVEEYDQYLRGEVYGYVVADGEDDEQSCWRFYGRGYVEKEAREVAEMLWNTRQEKLQKKTKAQIKNKVPLNKRKSI